MSQPIGIDVNNSGSPVTSTATGGPFDATSVGIGARPDGSLSSSGLDVAEIVVSNTTPTNTQLSQMQTYFHVTRGYY